MALKLATNESAEKHYLGPNPSIAEPNLFLRKLILRLHVITPSRKEGYHGSPLNRENYTQEAPISSSIQDESNDIRFDKNKRISTLNNRSNAGVTRSGVHCSAVRRVLKKKKIQESRYMVNPGQ